jgi:hypothetical protein
MEGFTGMAYIGTRMAIYMTVNGREISVMAMAFIHTLMEMSMMV